MELISAGRELEIVILGNFMLLNPVKLPEGMALLDFSVVCVRELIWVLLVLTPEPFKSAIIHQSKHLNLRMVRSPESHPLHLVLLGSERYPSLS